ncbi:MAG TPA: sigma-70 family RNA polymerase sigma factor [Polyangia bacterium]|nr:sigma-70 family RNA polymerase sigma factor [Polyangia bacterium]
MQTTTTTTTRPALSFDDFLHVEAANDVDRCSPDDPVAGMKLVRRIAAALGRRLPAHIERDELVALGALGWVEARARFDAARGVPFAGFAAMRIRGAILDGLRATDTLSRDDRKRARAAGESAAPRIFADDALVAAAAAPAVDADGGMVHDELLEELRAALATLPERDRYVVARHFLDEVPLKSIGAELGVTESRICQLVSRAVARLRDRFGIALLPTKKTNRNGRGAHVHVSEVPSGVAA